MKIRLALVLGVLALLAVAFKVGADGMLSPRRVQRAAPAAAPDVPELLGGRGPLVLTRAPSQEFAPIQPTPPGELAQPTAAPSAVDVLIEDQPDVYERSIEVGGYGPEWGSGGSGYSY